MDHEWDQLPSTEYQRYRNLQTTSCDISILKTGKEGLEGPVSAHPRIILIPMNDSTGKTSKVNFFSTPVYQEVLPPIAVWPRQDSYPVQKFLDQL